MTYPANRRGCNAGRRNRYRRCRCLHSADDDDLTVVIDRRRAGDVLVGAAEIEGVDRLAVAGERRIKAPIASKRRSSSDSIRLNRPDCGLRRGRDSPPPNESRTWRSSEVLRRRRCML